MTAKTDKMIKIVKKKFKFNRRIKKRTRHKNTNTKPNA